MISCQAKTCKTDAEKVDLKIKQNTLVHRIQAWRKVQAIYIPCAAPFFETLKNSSLQSVTLHPESVPLLLPSSLPQQHHNKGCLPGIIDKEVHLRRAQAEDALHNIRRSLCLRQGLTHYKHVHVEGPGQKANTRATSLLLRFQE